MKNIFKELKWIVFAILTFISSCGATHLHATDAVAIPPGMATIAMGTYALEQPNGEIWLCISLPEEFDMATQTWLGNCFVAQGVLEQIKNPVTVEERRRQVNESLRAAGIEPLHNDDEVFTAPETDTLDLPGEFRI